MISYTPYSKENQTFSDRAHEFAQTNVYPDLFETCYENLSFDDVTGMEQERNQILDGEMAVDKIVNVTVERLGAPLVFTVQERFRRPKYMQFQDITITEWNINSNQPSELYKIKAGFFMYGYYDEVKSKLVGPLLVVNVSTLLLRIATRQLTYQTRRSPRGNQRFITVPFYALDQLSVVEFRLNFKP